MAKKFKTLIFLMTFLTCSAFSAHAMVSEEADHELNVPTRSAPSAVDPREEEEVRAFFSHYDFPDFLREGVYSQVKGKAFELNEYGVPNLDFTAALMLYNKRRVPEEFSLLFDLFTKTPLEKRQPLWEDLNAFAEVGSKGAQLCEFYYYSNNNIGSSRYIVPGTTTLKGKLFDLPHQ